VAVAVVDVVGGGAGVGGAPAWAGEEGHRGGDSLVSGLEGGRKCGQEQ